MAQLKTIKRFELWKADQSNVEEVFRLMVEEGKGIRDTAFALGVPYTLLYPFLNDGGEMQKRYEAALAAKAEQMQHEALEIADAVKPDRDNVAKAKLQVDVRGALASKWNRERYGEKQDKGAGGITVLVDRSCGGQVSVESGAHRVVVGGSSQEKVVSGAEASGLPAEISQEA